MIRGGAAFGGIVGGLVTARLARSWDEPVMVVAGYARFFVIGLGFVNAPTFTTTFWIYVVLFGLTGFSRGHLSRCRRRRDRVEIRVTAADCGWSAKLLMRSSGRSCLRAPPTAGTSIGRAR